MLSRFLCFAVVASTATTCFGQFANYGYGYQPSPFAYSTPPAYSGPFTVYQSNKRADFVFHGYIYPVYPGHAGSFGHRRLPGQWWDGSHYPASTLPPYLSYGAVNNSHKPWSIIPNDRQAGTMSPQASSPRTSNAIDSSPIAPPIPPRDLYPPVKPTPPVKPAPPSPKKEKPEDDPTVESPEFRAQASPRPPIPR